jgi:hypothetical protein
MPPTCTVKIFDLAGNLIRVLEKDDENSSLLSWDLKNSFDKQVASGVYVYHVDVPDVGSTIGKLAIIAAQ